MFYFIILIVNVYSQTCGGLFSAGNGVISSPPDPGNAALYANGMDCDWTIGTEGFQVRIEFAEGW